MQKRRSARLSFSCYPSYTPPDPILGGGSRCLRRPAPSALLLCRIVRLLGLLRAGLRLLARLVLRSSLVHLRLGRAAGAILGGSGSGGSILAAMAVETTLAAGFTGFGRGELVGSALGVGRLAAHAGDLALFLPIHGGEAAITVPRILCICHV
ncbi:hypothetical protein Hsero_2261 [Herbaspirillum seropedicae SmR1]|uniref:Uncharacterized protein n=1 Tax=Herbaspirillum seropedicae (strain SmR1) TaxID=757424 RepID=D8IU98_HERSS|nr:hypothetical protein Hsero_2261 [Herbaspirillum seropedicae SmR1]